MRIIMLRILAGTVIALVATAGWAVDVEWNGSAGSNPANGLNWSNGAGPGAADTAVVGSTLQSPDFAGQTFTWGRLRTTCANNFGDAGGGGVLNLVGVDNSQFFSEGDNHQSTVAFDIVATKNIQTNGSHSVTFNGDVTAAKIEAFGGSTATFNGVVTQTSEFMSIGGGAKVVINNEFYWNNNGHGINNSPVVELGAGARFFRPNGSGGYLPGLDVFNIFNEGVVRIVADNALGTSGDTDLWSRNTTNTFDLNGFNQVVEFFGLGDGAAFNLNFGAATGPNQLIWDASHQMNGAGLYNVQNFEPGIDTLEFGQFGGNGGFNNPAILSRITINGAAYSATDPGTGAWWSTVPTPNPGDDPGRQIAVYHVPIPEPATWALAALAAVVVIQRRRTIR